MERGGDPVPGGPGRRRDRAGRRARVPGARRPARSSATCGGVRVHSVYVPNGRTPGLRPLPLQARLAGRADARWSAAGPDAALVCGDMNIAPADADVFDPAAYVGQTHVTPPEREALAKLEALGLHDVVRDRWPAEQRVHLLGLPGRDVPPGPGHADRPGAGQRSGGAAGSGRPGSTGRRARAPARATTPRSSWTWTRRRTATSARWCRRRRRRAPKRAGQAAAVTLTRGPDAWRGDPAP